MKNILGTLAAFAGCLRARSRVVGSIVNLVALGNDELAMVFQASGRPMLFYVTTATRLSLGATLLRTSDLWRHCGSSASVAYHPGGVSAPRKGECLLAHSIEITVERAHREAA